VEVDLPSAPGVGGLLPDLAAELPVLWEDPWLVAVVKPAGVATHPIRTGETGTLAQALVARYPEMEGVGFSRREPGLLHRLDRGTSGVLLAARTASAFESLRDQFAQQRVVKIYLAVVSGCPEAADGTVSFPLGSRGRRARRVVAVRSRRGPSGLRSVHRAETAYRLLRRGEACSLLRLVMRSGVRHQIRAHMGALGHPVVGDRLYGPEEDPPAAWALPPARHLLHAAEVRFFHPEDGREMRIRCPLPEDFRSFLRRQGLTGMARRA